MRVKNGQLNITHSLDPHIARRNRIRKHYPEIRHLIGNNPYSAVLVFLLVALQLVISYCLQNQSIIYVVVGSYLIGAYISSSLYSLIHDASHKLIFRSTTGNKIIAIIANIPLVNVGAMPFFRYHRTHHTYFNDYYNDVGVPTKWEADWVNNSSLRKVIWLVAFPLFQWKRTEKHAIKKPYFDTWMVRNILIQVIINVLILWACGLYGLIYLGLSMSWSFGLHPLGTRVIQEHFVVEPGQETNNYTGFSKIFECNFGLHAEHHDFPFIPWNRLPQVSRIAPEEYQCVPKFRSRLLLLIDFIINPKWSLYQSTVRIKENSPNPLTSTVVNRDVV